MRICPECKRKTAAPLCERDGFETVPQNLVPPTKTSQDLIGRVIENRFLVEAWIGGHRSCAVYRATQLQVGRQVALRIIEPRLTADLRWVAAFQRQARVLGSFTHPHLAQVFDFGPLEDGSIYVASELVRGKALHETLGEQGRLSAKRTTTLGLQVLEGLVEAHTHGILHFDLTPENIMLVDEGGRRERVKIVGFGILKGLSEETNPATWAGRSEHSARYMDPELSRGRGATGRADLYALACILFEALTGKLPFDGKCAADYLVAHATAKPAVPYIDGSEVHGPLIDFIYRCLEKDPQDRFGSTGDAIAALQACTGAPLRTGPAPRHQQPVSAPPSSGRLPAVQVDDLQSEPHQSTIVGVARPVAPPAVQPVAGSTRRGAPNAQLAAQVAADYGGDRDGMLRMRGQSMARSKIVAVPTSRRTRRPSRHADVEPDAPLGLQRRRERLVPKITNQKHLSATVIEPVAAFEDDVDWPRRRGGWLWVVAALALCACGAVALWQFMSPPTKTAAAVSEPSATLLVIDEAHEASSLQRGQLVPAKTAPADPVPQQAAQQAPAVKAVQPVANPIVGTPTPTPRPVAVIPSVADVVTPLPAANVRPIEPIDNPIQGAVDATGVLPADPVAAVPAGTTDDEAATAAAGKKKVAKAFEGSSAVDDRATERMYQRQRDAAATERLAAKRRAAPGASAKSSKTRRSKRGGGRLVDGVWQEGASSGSVRDDAWDPKRDTSATRKTSSRFVREVRSASSAQAITIESSPSGATVYLGTERIGRTPLRVMHGDPHGKRVKLTMAGYETKNVRMPGNGRIDVTLTPR